MMSIILMADIVSSSKRRAKALMDDFKQVVAAVNKQDQAQILSPLTITLGDEFQGVLKSPAAAVQVIIDLEQEIMRLKKPFKLRYIVQEGDIETKINKQKAHEMLGSGLTNAREKLLAMKTGRSRFSISLADNRQSEKLNLMFSVFQGISDRWTAAQQKIVVTFLKFDDYKTVAGELKKDPTAVWRRKRTLMIDEFNNLKKLILMTAANK